MDKISQNMSEDNIRKRVLEIYKGIEDDEVVVIMPVKRLRRAEVMSAAVRPDSTMFLTPQKTCMACKNKFDEEDGFEHVVINHSDDWPNLDAGPLCLGCIEDESYNYCTNECKQCGGHMLGSCFDGICRHCYGHKAILEDLKKTGRFDAIAEYVGRNEMENASDGLYPSFTDPCFNDWNDKITEHIRKARQGIVLTQ